MSRGRHALQRSNRVRLKADVLVLLERVETLPLEAIEDEIAEMRVRLKPPTGAAAPIVLTGYTQMGKDGKVRTLHNGGKVNTLVPSDPEWEAGAIVSAKDDSIKGVHFTAAFTGDLGRYRKN